MDSAAVSLCSNNTAFTSNSKSLCTTEHQNNHADIAISAISSSGSNNTITQLLTYVATQ